MNYKEKVIALLNSQELSNEQKEKLESIFPELKESEDVRIRKALIRYFTLSDEHAYNEACGVSYRDIVAWLEKQGESIKIKKGKNYLCTKTHKYAGEEWIKDTKYYASDNYTLVNQECEYYCPEYSKEEHNELFEEVKYDDCAEKQDDANKEYWRGYRDGKQEILDKYDELEKQGEQKPADKVEPKFREGEWITNGDYTWKVVEVKPLDYILQSQDGNIVDDTISHVDEQFHFFIIQDAKDGDVLAAEPIEGYPSLFVAINKKQNEEDFDSYCFVGFNGEFYKNEHKHYAKNVHPATKKQRDFFFKKMKEAGYEWDAEKKKLKKITVELTDFEKSLKHIMIETLECGDTHNLKADADMLLRLAQKSTEWSEEDEHWRQHIIDFMKHPDLIKATPTLVKNAIDWLKSLRPQPKQEWSEEDEKKLLCICAWIKDYPRIANFTDEMYTVANNYVDWLKSLKPRNRWKPSDEQMHAFEQVYDWYNNNFAPSETLTSLYSDLKKLKG